MSSFECNTPFDYSSWEDVKGDVICILCRDYFQNPYTLTCSHTFCGECIEIRTENGKKVFDCPSCLPFLVRVRASCKSKRFPNHYLARLTKLFVNRTSAYDCSECITKSYMCENCYSMGCSKCIRHKPCTDGSCNHCLPEITVNIYDPPDVVMAMTTKLLDSQLCVNYESESAISYCGRCDTIKCVECLQSSCANHKLVFVKYVKEELLKKLVPFNEGDDGGCEMLDLLAGAQEKLKTQEEKLKQKLDADIKAITCWYDHAYHCLHQEKQIAISKITAFQRLLIENNIKKLNDEIKVHLTYVEGKHNFFTNLFEKSSLQEVILYYKHVCDRNPLVFYQNKRLDKIFSDLRLISKICLERTTKRVHICISEKNHNKCNVETLPNHVSTGIKRFKWRFISYSQPLDDFKPLTVKPVVIFGKEYSIFTLPHDTSELVQNSKQKFLGIIKGAACVSQLQLLTRVFSIEKSSALKEKAILLCSDLIGTNSELLQITETAMYCIKEVIVCLEFNDIASYIAKILDQVETMEQFVRRSEIYSKTNISEYTLDLQNQYISGKLQQSEVIHMHLLQDVMAQCLEYLHNVHQGCNSFLEIRNNINILSASSGINVGNYKIEKFCAQMIEHYSMWIALNQTCTKSKELINCWTAKHIV